MTREAEAEAWVRKPKRIIHNQSLIQLLIIFATISPLAFAGLIFWLIFAVYPLMVQSLIALWAVSAVIYVSLAVYIRIKQRSSL